MSSKLKRLAIVVTLVTIVAVAIGAPAFAADTPKPIYKVPASGDVAVSLNMLWVVLGAVLVIFMQAGFALVEAGFCRAKHAAHVMATNFAIFGLGFVGFFLIGYTFMFGGFSFPGAFGLDSSTGGPLIGSGQLGLPVARRLRVDEPPRSEERGAGGGDVPLHGRVHGHDRDDPDGRDGRAVEVEGVRRLGPVLRRDLLPDLRPRGPGAAAGSASSGTA